MPKRRTTGAAPGGVPTVEELTRLIKQSEKPPRDDDDGHAALQAELRALAFNRQRKQALGRFMEIPPEPVPADGDPGSAAARRRDLLDVKRRPRDPTRRNYGLRAASRLPQ